MPLADGRCVNAVELLHQFYELARSEFRGRDKETDDLLNLWENILWDLARSSGRFGRQGGLDYEAVAVSAVRPGGKDSLV